MPSTPLWPRIHNWRVSVYRPALRKKQNFFTTNCGQQQSPFSHQDIWIFDLDRNTRRRLTFDGFNNYNETFPVLSPDGRFVAYVSAESGQFEVYVRPVVGPGKWLISQGGGGKPLWRGDGRELFYRRGRQVLAVPVRTEPSFSVGESKVLFEGHYDLSASADQHYDVSPDGQRFAMMSVGQISPTPIRVVLNWAVELERIFPTGN